MKMYIVNNDTVALIEELDVYGNSYTRIIEGRKYIRSGVKSEKDF